MILGIVGILGVCFVVGGLLLGVPAIILGVLGRKEIRSGGQQGGGMAVAGIVLGILASVLSAIYIAFMIAFFATNGFGEGLQGFE